MTLNPTCKRVETIEGVPLTVTGVAQVKVLSDEQILALACEQFLDLDLDRIENTILQTLEGHLRAILGTLTVEAIYKVLVAATFVLPFTQHICNLYPFYHRIEINLPPL